MNHVKLIILDRDGVINYDSPNYIKTPEEWIPIPGSLEAIAQLCQAGFSIAVASNQSGIGRGYYTTATLEAIHQKMLDAAAAAGGKIEKIVYCPHIPSDNCTCRKPKTGLLKIIADYFHCDLNHVPFIGDQMSDVEAAIAAHAIPILVDEKTESPYFIQAESIAYYRCKDLAEAATMILSGAKNWLN